MRHLVVVRHAKAEADAAGGDHERALTARGRAQAEQVAEVVAALGAGVPAPTLVLTSSARRAVQTAEPLGRRLPSVPVDVDASLYRADADDLVDRLRLLGDEPTVVVVGHNPAAVDLVALLVGAPPDRFPPASVAVVALGVDRWAQTAGGCGALLELHHPSG